MFRTSTAPVLAMALLAGPVVAQECGAPTPQELYQRFQAFAQRGEYAEMLGCLAPEQRTQATFVLLVASAFAVSLANLDAEPSADGTPAAPSAMATAFDELLSLHGVPEREPATLLQMDPSEAPALLEGLDEAGVVRDLMEFLETYGSQEGSLTQVDRSAGARLSQVSVDGDRALGLVEGEPVYFVRLDGLWYATDVPGAQP